MDRHRSLHQETRERTSDNAILRQTSSWKRGGSAAVTFHSRSAWSSGSFVDSFGFMLDAGRRDCPPPEDVNLTSAVRHAPFAALAARAYLSGATWKGVAGAPGWSRSFGMEA